MTRLLDRLLDQTVVLSFDRNGYRRHAARFDPADLDRDLSGRRAVVTGANSGIGFAIAEALLSRGADVVMMCRSPKRGQAAIEKLSQHTGRASVELLVVDVTDPSTIDEAARAIEGRAVDILVHNAGMMARERELVGGQERTLATHVLGPYRLTERLRPHLERSSDGRVVFVASGGMYTQRLDPEALFAVEGPFDGTRAYAQAKRAQVVLTPQLDETFRGTSVSVHAMHPGWADTGAVQTSMPVFHRLTKRILRSPAEGADTAVWLAMAEEPRARSGRFWFDRAEAPLYGLPGTRETAEAREELWRRVEQAALQA